MEERIEGNTGNENGVDENPFKKGCNPAYSTARGKLQQKRSRLNDDIIKELRLRRGAENLLRATTNKEIKEKVQIELGFVQSKLEVLKGDLAELNSSVKTYQNENSSSSVPMISLGLKETKDANFQTVFMDYIEEHYTESGANYTENIKKLHALRKAIRTPTRSEAGIELLFMYHNQLGYIQKRFYPPGRVVPVYFTWYDSLTGALTTQKTLGYEKGSVLFNIAALYTQLGTAQDRGSVSGLDKAIDYYQKSAGILKYLRDRFAHAPSLDMKTETLTLLVQLMLSQGQECVYERMIIAEGPPVKFAHLIKYSQEAAMVSNMYEETHNAVAGSKAIRTDVPASWLTMTIMKCNHYLSMAHYYLASALQLSKDLLPTFNEVTETLKNVTVVNTNSSKSIQYSENVRQQKQYCRSHLNQAISLNETAERDYSFCRMLRTNDDVFLKVLSEAESEAKMLLLEVSDDNNYEDIFLSAAAIVPKTDKLVQITLQNFSDYKVEDFFSELGPISVFSAQSEWTSPRTVTLTKGDKLGFGFTIMGDNPSKVVELEADSSAQMNAIVYPDTAEGLKIEDILVAVNGVNVKCKSLPDIKSLIMKGGDTISLSVVTPMPPTIKPVIEISKHNDTIRSSNSSGSGDMHQLGDTMTGTWRKKMKSLTFLKTKKSSEAALKESLRKK